MMPTDKELLDRIQEWKDNPGAMFDWRSDVLKLSLLVLEEIIRTPKGQGRAQDLSRIRAISQLQALTQAMETMRSSIPTVCPECGHEYVLQ